MKDKFVKLCTCRACNSVFIDTDPGEQSISYPGEVVKQFDLKSLVDNDCQICKKGDSELISNLDVNMKKAASVQRYIIKITPKHFISV